MFQPIIKTAFMFLRSDTVPLTRAFKSGNSQAVRIPAELAYPDPGADLRITRLGDVITIMPARYSLKHAVEILRGLPKPSEVERREPIEMPDRIID